MTNNIFKDISAEQDYRRRETGLSGRGGAPGLGGAPIIMTFVILCLTIFAALTLSTASSEYSLSSDYTESVRAYYAADAEGARFVASLRIAAGVSPQTAVTGKYADAAFMLGADSTAKDGAVYITHDITIDGGQVLCISLTADNTGLRVTSWRIVYSGEWLPDNNFNLWTDN